MKDIISWNVNGIRAIQKKGFVSWLKETNSDIVCLQETKAHPDQLTETLLSPDGYKSVWASAEKKGYSGTCVYYKTEPESVDFLDVPEFDSEGRVLILSYKKFVLLNAYFPNSQSEGRRIKYKIDFCNAVFDKLKSLTSKKKDVLLCGDYNIAHKPIDLFYPERNEKSPGYLPEERAWMEKFTQSGFTDTFRMFNQEPGNYTWWSYRTKARDKNIGWRIDYHCVNDAFKNKVKSSVIMPEVMGSDHCPLKVTLNTKL